MGLKEDLESDIRQFFNQIESQGSEDQVKTLRNLLDKHIHLNKAEHKLGTNDLNEITSNSKVEFSNKVIPIQLNDRQNPIPNEQQHILCIVEATISQLNKNDCLKRMPRFDYKRTK